MDATVTELGRSSYRQGMVDSWRGIIHRRQKDYVAEEVPIVLVYNNKPHVVMLATPLNLEDFALGFSLTEEILLHPSELHSIRVVQRAKGIEVRMRIPEYRFSQIESKGRNMTGRTGCGLCGATTLDQAIRKPNPVGVGFSLEAEAMMTAFEKMQQQQALHQLTGAVHAAAWLAANNNIQMIREDVGRHNALDKLIGTLSRTGCQFDNGCLLITSRASYEMVQKAATVGISLMAAVSAPTALAIKLANECGLTLIGFARNNNYVIYTHPHRIQHHHPMTA